MLKFIISTLFFSLALATGKENLTPIKFRLRRDKEILQLCVGDAFKIDGLDNKSILNIFGKEKTYKCKFGRDDKRGKDIVNLLALKDDGIDSDLVVKPSENDDDIVFTLRDKSI